MNNLSSDIADSPASNVQIFLYVALPCEAKPLVKYFNLKKETAIQAFSIYQNSTITLAVSGVGKSAMAAAVAYSQALYGKSSNAVFLNIGIAGHKTCPLGKAFCIEKIIDYDTGRNFYPQLVIKPLCPTLTLCTVSIAKNSYPENYLYDMEASAFYQTAIRFSSSELIQCLKVVSDNETSNIENINTQQISKIIGTSVEIIEKLLFELAKLAALGTRSRSSRAAVSCGRTERRNRSLHGVNEDFEHHPTANGSGAVDLEQVLTKSSETDLYLQFISLWHFSSSNRLRLKNLLSKWQIITDNATLPLATMDCNNGKEFLQKLENEIEQCDYRL